MCGIAGIYDPVISGNELEQRIRAMTSSISHRGPDHIQTFSSSPIALGHARLSILDLSENGFQPMKDNISGVTITFNGEIYNFKDLKKELVSLGHKFSSSSDTEVILKSYLEWGMPGLKKCEGIFALCIWDPRRNKVILLRDRLGVKPLYYRFSDGQLSFGSELKCLMTEPNKNYSLNDQSFMEYLWFGNFYEDRTIFKDIHQLEPGNWLILENSNFSIESWWSVENYSNLDKFQGTFSDAVEVLNETIDDSVNRQLISDVPVGIFLSGGLDSSAIAASASNLSAKRLDSFSAGFDFDKGVNEIPKAKKVADILGLKHHELKIKGTNIQETIIDLVRFHDEPFADAANIPLFLMARELKGKIKVVLQGDGGDEMFAGY